MPCSHWISSDPDRTNSKHFNIFPTETWVLLYVTLMVWLQSTVFPSYYKPEPVSPLEGGKSWAKKLSFHVSVSEKCLQVNPACDSDLWYANDVSSVCVPQVTEYLNSQESAKSARVSRCLTVPASLSCPDVCARLVVCSVSFSGKSLQRALMSTDQHIPALGWKNVKWFSLVLQNISHGRKNQFEKCKYNVERICFHHVRKKKHTVIWPDWQIPVFNN